MNDAQRVIPPVPHSLGFLQKLLILPFGLLYRFWVSTIRFRFLNEASQKETEENKYPVIITLWHNRLFLAGEWQRRYRRDRKCFGLISGSRDGAWLEAFYGWSGIHSVRGSSNRGGSKAIRDLVRKLKDGLDIGITPDGSRGPCYVAKPGGLLVAKISRAPFLLVSFEYGWHLKLKSWDRFVLPFPFSKVRVRTELIRPDDILSNDSVEEACKVLGEELMKLTIDRD